jgi:hypothetical protein
MKAKLLPSLLLACFMQQAPSAEPTRLEAHEWGTFTVLGGSDGVPLNWFQGPGFADELPAFVQFNPFRGKAAFPAQGSLVRMETPVIYFYPEKPMRVSVSATFHGGELTEWFPSPRRSGNTTEPVLPLTWDGELLPPSDTAVQAQIPEVPPGKGEHYRHAREVPGAWIFRTVTSGKNADKFIFYRGKGHNAPPYCAQAGSDGSVNLMHWGPGGGIPHAFALTVKDGSTQWSRLPRLEATKDGDAASFNTMASIHLNQPGTSSDLAAIQLASAMREALVSAGLTPDEARAMVATWDGHWFSEPGTRVLAILPREWVDSVLPLTITPAPEKLTRVFVARFEVLTPERENALAALLDDDTEAMPGALQSARFQGLQLGRFASGALLRVQNLESQRMSAQFWKLQASLTKKSTAPTTVAR